jgi:hypothetical protein
MSRFTRSFVFTVTAFLLIGPAFVSTAEAKPQFLTAFVGEYPSATQLFTCGTCHTNFDGPQDDGFVIIVAGEDVGDGENAYARAFKEAGGEDFPAAAFAAIENLDSDHDGTANGDEILTGAGFMPGYSCANYLSTLNSPPNLAFFVDPVLPGCGTATTTLPSSTTTSTTSSTSPTSTTSTSTTLLPVEGCAAPVSGSSFPTATDCLFILGAAVGTKTCETECLCAPKGSLPVSATDALLCLRAAVGESVPLDCPCGSTSTTTSTSITSTSTTTSTSTSTSVTTSSTTTTTMPSAVDAGRATYDARCSSCHKAGSYDTTGFAADLRTKGGLLVTNLGSLDPVMASITLTQKEISDLQAFLGSL